VGVLKSYALVVVVAILAGFDFCGEVVEDSRTQSSSLQRINMA
jgi:hypothetical protein